MVSQTVIPSRPTRNKFVITPEIFKCFDNYSWSSGNNSISELFPDGELLGEYTTGSFVVSPPVARCCSGAFSPGASIGGRAQPLLGSLIGVPGCIGDAPATGLWLNGGACLRRLSSSPIPNGNGETENIERSNIECSRSTICRGYTQSERVLIGESAEEYCSPSLLSLSSRSISLRCTTSSIKMFSFIEMVTNLWRSGKSSLMNSESH